MSVTASLVSAPAGNTKLPVFDLVETTTAIAGSTATGGGQNVGALTGLVQYVQATGATTASAKYKVYMNAPEKVGTYVVKLTPAVSGVGTLNATAQTLTITVTAAPADDLVAATATSILNAGETASATADVVVTSTRKQGTTLAGTAAAATIKITTLNKSALAAG